jgi:hypothetical protein
MKMTPLDKEKARVRWQALFAEKHGEIVRQQKERKLKAERLALIKRVAGNG